MVGICFLKLSIVALYLRTLAKTKTFRWSCYLMELTLVAAHIAVLVVTLTMCRPIESWWSYVEGYECGDDEVEIITLAVFVLFTDIIILLLPIRTVWKLCLPRRERIAIILIFHAGAL
jgi:hypothetical protein